MSVHYWDFQFVCNVNPIYVGKRTTHSRTVNTSAYLLKIG